MTDVIKWRNSLNRQRQFPWVLPVTPEQERELHIACDYFLEHKSIDYRKVICGNYIYVYTNKPQDWSQVEQALPFAKLLSATEIKVTLPRDCVVLKKPKNKFRTYFKEKFMSDSDINNVRRFFGARQTQFKPSPAFNYLLIGKKSFIESHHFVDHDDSNFEFLINLACPGIVSKTLPIVPLDK